MKKKKKFAPRFAIARRGYDIDSVEAYIALEREKADRAGLEQKERIRLLKAQCERLTAELGVYRDKEEQIKSALITAGEQAEKIVLDTRLRYAMELERLKLFRAKWTGAYEELKERYDFGKDALNMESVAVSVKLELERFLAQDFSLDRGDPCDETESEYSITGILVVNGAEYPVQGGMETEEEEGESESELTFVAYTGVDSYIRVEQEFEQEEGEREQKYVYTVAENGRVLEKTEVEYEEEEGEVKLKMTVQRADGTKDELSFEDESEKGVRKLRVDARMDGEEISFCIYIEQEVYRYEFENGSHDFDRHWHDDDDDDDD